MPELTIDFILAGESQLDAIWDGLDFPKFTLKVKEHGVLEFEKELHSVKTKNIVVPGKPVFFGRSSECPIQIPPECGYGRCVSRRHGAFAYDNGWLYEHIAENNMTYLNDHPLPPKSVARIIKDTVLGIGPVQPKPMKYAISLKLRVH